MENNQQTSMNVDSASTSGNIQSPKKPDHDNKQNSDINSKFSMDCKNQIDNTTSDKQSTSGWEMEMRVAVIPGILVPVGEIKDKNVLKGH